MVPVWFRYVWHLNYSKTKVGEIIYNHSKKIWKKVQQSDKRIFALCTYVVRFVIKNELILEMWQEKLIWAVRFYLTLTERICNTVLVTGLKKYSERILTHRTLKDLFEVQDIISAAKQTFTRVHWLKPQICKAKIHWKSVSRIWSSICRAYRPLIKIANWTNK